MHAAVSKLVFARANSISVRTDSIVEVWRDYQGNIQARVSAQGDRFWIDVPGVGCYSFDRCAGAVEVDNVSCATDLVYEVFWRYVLPAVLYIRGCEVVHASAVVFPQGVCALCGDSEAGKSTLAHGLARRGYPLFADDAVAFEPMDDRVATLPLPFRVRLREPSARHFGEPSVLLEPQPGGYAEHAVPNLAMLILLDRCDSMPLGSQPEVTWVPTGDAFVSSLHHAYMSCPDEARKRRMVRQYMALCRQVPILRLRFGSGLNHLNEILTAIERAVSGADERSMP